MNAEERIGTTNTRRLGVQVILFTAKFGLLRMEAQKFYRFKYLMNSAISLILMLSTFRNYWVEYVQCRLRPQFIDGGGEDCPLSFQFLYYCTS